MTGIKQGQELIFKNVLCFKGKLSERQLEQELLMMMNFMGKQGVVQVGPIITATHNVEIHKGVTILDMQILLPINKEIRCKKSKYYFLEEFKLLNAVYARHLEDVELLEDTINLIIKYISDNRLVSNTPIYNVQLPDAVTGNLIVDCYMGIA